MRATAGSGGYWHLDGVIGRPACRSLANVGAALQADGWNEVRIRGLEHQMEKRSMDHFAGLDVSVKETSVCIVDDTGRIVREMKVASERVALLSVLTNPGYHFKRIALGALHADQSKGRDAGANEII